MRLINTCLKSPTLDHGLFGPNTFNMVEICISHKPTNFGSAFKAHHVCHCLFLLPALPVSISGLGLSQILKVTFLFT